MLVIVVKRLKVLATCRELWVSGKPSNFLGPASGHTSHSFLGIRWITWIRDEVGAHLNCRAILRLWGTRWVPYSRGEWACPWIGKRSQRLLWSDSSVLQACVLGLPCKDEIRFELFRLSWILRLLNRFATWSKKWNNDDIQSYWMQIIPLPCLCR